MKPPACHHQEPGLPRFSCQPDPVFEHLGGLFSGATVQIDPPEDLFATPFSGFPSRPGPGLPFVGLVHPVFVVGLVLIQQFGPVLGLGRA